MTKKSQKIKNHWDSIAKEYKTDPKGTMPDANLRKLEFNNIVKYINGDDKLLDIGCGAGTFTLELAKYTKNTIIGVDYSEKMIEYAQMNLKKIEATLCERVHFHVQNILNTSLQIKTDKVITQRCLINLTDRAEQLQAITNIASFLNPGGIALLSEDTMQGYNNVNILRNRLNMENLGKRWNNLPIDETIFTEEPIESLFRLKEIVDYTSTYYLISRVINLKFAEMMGHDKEFYPELDEIASELPSVGNYGLLRLLIIERK